jgi:hypothetical protein
MAIWYILFTAKWYILCPFGKLCGHLVHWYVARRKIWQPWSSISKLRSAASKVPEGIKVDILIAIINYCAAIFCSSSGDLCFVTIQIYFLFSKFLKAFIFLNYTQIVWHNGNTYKVPRTALQGVGKGLKSSPWWDSNPGSFVLEADAMPMYYATPPGQRINFFQL